MLVSVYRPADGTDCSLRGLSSRVEEAVLVEEKDLPKNLAADNDYLVIVRRKIIVDEYLSCKPAAIKGHSMFGGNFVYSSDSRFPSRYPIPVHDRVEK